MVNVGYLLALHSIDGLGPIRLKSLLNFFNQDPKLAWNATKTELEQAGMPKNVVELLLGKRRRLDPEALPESLNRSGISWLSLFDENYPASLKQIYDPPVILYYQGQILPQDQKAIGIVGSRKMTGYGQLVTEKFTTELVNAGLTIVSGLARGVDSAAHWAALRSQGRTLAVLGGGLENIFPPENRSLAQQITQGQGAILSEFPPSYPSLPGNFPARNRIIAGLSLAVLVTEAAIDSGSLITARQALEMGKDVFAVPGAITSYLSKGTIELIREGARPVSEAAEILEELGLDQVRSDKGELISQGNLGENEQKILNFLEAENRHIDEVCRGLNIAPAIVSGALLKMEILGLVRNLGGGVYCRV